MSEPVHTGYEIGYEERGALDYFHQSTEDKYIDETKYKIVLHKWRETTVADDEAQGLRDWEWYIEVFKKEETPDE